MSKRNIQKETSKIQIGKSKAVSSHRALMYHLISPSTIERLAKRMTDGGIKYGSVQWRIGINDVDYVAERLDHLYEHLMNFMREGNSNDDNLGAMLWCLNFLITVEELNPSILNEVLNLTKLHGASAEASHNAEMLRRK